MGGCLSEKKFTNQDFVEYFKKDKQINALQKQPLFSTLYRILREQNNIEIIRSVDEICVDTIFHNEQTINFNNLSNIDIKMLFSFKTILMVGNCKNQKIKILQHSNPKCLYLISEQTALKFIRKYPIFSSKIAQIQKKKIPLLIFAQNQLLQKSEGYFELYLHLKNYENPQVKKQLRIEQTYFLTEQNYQELKNKIIKEKNKHVLLTHQSSMQKDKLVTLFTEILTNKFHTGVLSTKIFLKRSFPHLQILNAQTKNESSNNENHVGREKSYQEGASKSKYFEHLKKLYKEMGKNKQAKNKLERSYNLLITLLTNIYTSNETNDQYRKVRKTNKQIYSLLGKYSSGVQLLKQLGFKDDKEYYNNETQNKYLKLFRTDLDLSYHYFLEYCQNKQN